VKEKKGDVIKYIYFRKKKNKEDNSFQSRPEKEKSEDRSVLQVHPGSKRRKVLIFHAGKKISRT